MAGPTIKEILLKFGIDNSNWKSAIQELGALLEKANKDSAKAAAQATKSLADQKAKLQELIEARKSEANLLEQQLATLKIAYQQAKIAREEQALKVQSQKAETAELNKQVAVQRLSTAEAAKSRLDIQTKILGEKVASSELSKQVIEQRLLQAAQRTLQAGVATRLANEKLLTAEINKQAAAARAAAQAEARAARAAQQHAASAHGAGGHGGGHGGGLGGIGTGFMRGLVGGGLFMQVSAAVAGGELLEHTIEHIVEELKELAKEVGPLQQVREQFEKLAPARGIEGIKFIEDLREATHGLVGDTQLYRNANLFLQSSVHASEEDILALTKATVGLARAQGKDAAEAVNALNRFFLTGRSQTLAWVTGIQRAQLTIGQTGRSADSASRSTLQFQQALEVLTKQYKAIGEPAETFTEVTNKLGVQTHRFFEEFVAGVERSKGFEGIVGFLSKAADKIGVWAEQAAEWGEKLSIAVSAAFEVVKDAFAASFGTAKAFFIALKDIVSAFTSLSPAMDDFVQKLFTLNGAVAIFSALFYGADAIIKDLAADLKWLATELPLFLQGATAELQAFVALATRNVKGFVEATIKIGEIRAKEKAAWTQFNSEVAANAEDLTAKLTKLDDLINGKGDNEKEYKIKFAAPAEIFSEQQQAAAAQKLAKIQEEFAIKTSKMQLDLTKTRIANEMELVQVQYDQGLLTYKQYLDAKDKLDRDEHAAALKNLDDEYKAKASYLDIETRQQRMLAEERKKEADVDRQMRMTDIAMQRVQLAMELEKSNKSPEEKNKITGELNEQYAALATMIDAAQKASHAIANAEMAEINAKKRNLVQDTQTSKAKENESFQRKGRSRTEQEINDEVKARQKMADALLAIKKEEIEQEKEIDEQNFQEGNTTAEEYLKQRVSYINQDYEAVLEAEQKKLEANKDSNTAQAEFSAKTAEAAAKREKDLTALTLQEYSIRSKAAEDAYNHAQQLIESQLQAEQQYAKFSPYGDRGGQQAMLSSLVALQQSRLNQLEQEKNSTKELSADWFDIQGKIAKTKDSLIEYNQELIKSRDYSGEISSLARGVATSASMFPKGGNTSSALNKFAQITDTLGKQFTDFKQRLQAQTDRRAGKTQAPVTPEEIFKALQKVSNETGDSLSVVREALEGAAEEVDSWKEGLSSSNNLLTTSIKDTTTKLESILISAANRVAGAFDKVAAAVGASGSPHAPTSGQGGPSGPDRTITASDIESLNATMRSGSVPGQEQAPASMAIFSATVVDATSNVKKLSSGTDGLQGLFHQLVSGGKDSFQNILGNNGLIGGFKDLFKGLDGASDKLGNFASGVQAIAGSAGGLVSAAKGQGGALNAGLTGLSSGMQLGSMFGPIGAGIGAGVGLLTGVFSGKARDAADKLAKQIVAKFNAALQNLNSGTQTLSATIQLEIQNIQQAVSSLSGKKGGRDTLKEILPGMESQLAQLQQQQKQIIQTFDDQLNTLNAPQAYQDQLSSIDQIIQKYQQYIQAGGNVANANEFLRQSYSNLVQNGINELNQDQQDAINNALQYNDLLTQRQNLIQDTNVQIQNIMSQGVAVRQMPEGVSKAIQIQQLMRDKQEQMDQLNQQIATSKYKLDTESQIFSMATTRIGLENQLVVLQNEQTDQDMKRIVALGSVVQALQTALPTSSQGALQELGLGAAYVSPLTEPGLKPVPPVKTGVADIDLQNQLQYQQALAAYQMQINQQVGFISPTGPIPTTSPIQSTISSQGILGTASVTMSSALTLAQQAAAAVATMNQNFNSTGTPSGTGGVPSLTINGQQIDTVSTSLGTALLVTTGAGTSATLGIVGTAQQVATAATNVFGAMAGLPVPRAPIAPVAAVAPTPVFSQPSPIVKAVAQTAPQILASNAIAPTTTDTAKPIAVFSPTPPSRTGTAMQPSVFDRASTTLSTSTATTAARLTAEATISSLSATRVASETQLVNLKMQEINADMTRIAAHNDLLERSKTGTAVANTFENSLQKVYETRGRQGFGGFYGELSNPS